MIVFYVQYKGTFQWLKSLNLSGFSQGEPSTRPPSWTTPQQLTLHLNDLILSYIPHTNFMLQYKE